MDTHEIDIEHQIGRGEKRPECGILAGEPEILGERCLDGGKCHHTCTQVCFRREFCSPLTLSGLNRHWEKPGEALEVVVLRVPKAVAALCERVGDAGIERILRAGITRQNLRPGSHGAWSEDQRHTIGEALTVKLADMAATLEGQSPDWFDAAHVDEVLDVMEDKLAMTAGTETADAERFRYLTADLSGEAREQRNAILARLPVMSYAAACAVIDITRAEVQC